MIMQGAEFWLKSFPIGLGEVKPSKSTRSIKWLNQYLSVPAFSIDASWEGASHLAGRFCISVWTAYHIRMPVVVANTTFCPCIKWTESGVVRRYKLWKGVGEKLAYPMYIGEVIPPVATLEIWTVRSNKPLLGSEWQLPVTILEMPSDVNDITASAIPLSGPCSGGDYLALPLDYLWTMCPICT